MRGPGDEAPVPAGTVLEREETQQRLPGGGALLRLVQELESNGYSELAEQAIQLAVPDEATDQVMETVAEMGLAPPRTTKRGKRTSRRAGTAGGGAGGGRKDPGIGIYEE